jgi:type VI secretion system secreted protein VgrG
VEGDVAESFKGNHSEETAGDVYLKGTNFVIEATAQLSLKVGGSSVVIDSSGVSVKGSLVTIDGSMVKIASGPGSSPGSGSSGSVVTPIAPMIPEDADVADPGEVNDLRREQRAKETGKYGNPVYLPLTPPSGDDVAAETEYTWIEIELVGEDGKPVPGERYKITSAEGYTAFGSLGPDGRARVEWMTPGECEITFPDLDEAAWEPT